VNFVGYSPERFQEGNTEWSFARTPRLVSGVSNEAAILARSFLGLVCEEVVDVKTPEVAEISKLVENAYIACNISLHGEINRLAAAHKVSGMAIADAAATKPYGYHPFWPGAGFGGHCLPNDLQMLRNAMAAVHIKSPLLDGAASVSAMVPEFLVDRLTEELGRSLDGEYVVIVGVGFKPGSSDTFCSPAEPVVRELRRSGAVVQYFDSLVTEFHVDGERVERAEFREKNRPGIAVVLIKDPAIKDLMLASFELLLDASRGGVQAGHNCRVVRI
jgi:nucleotide sugar dehydrogenase